ncbi:MAG: hypothetical protein JNJ58_13500 [Chitinophagaceae bacterium]|nr:hypothetical protein [Chitinophagaceae bacterium]
MSEPATQNPEKKKWYHCNYRVIGVSLCVILFILIVGNTYIYYLVNKKEKDSTKVISNILMNAAKEKPLIPDIIIVNKKDSSLTKLDSTLKKNLIEFLSKKYSSENADSNSTFDIKPYLGSTDIKDEDKIVKHIEFLSNTVKEAVEDSKRNIDTEISKVNTWVTIWIGIIGFLGIFFPLIINLKSLDELKSIKAKSKEAKKNADDAKKKLDKYKTHLDTLPENMGKVEGFEKTIKEQGERIEKIDKLATNAETKSANTEKLLYTLNMVFKLKDIDGTYLMHNKEPLKALIKYFEEIHKELSDPSVDFKHPFAFDALRQLALRLYVLSSYSFISKENMTFFNILSEYITVRLEAGLTQESFNEILVEFDKLIKALKNS